MGLHRVAEAGATGIGGVGDPRVVAIAEAAKELDRLRENWRNPPDAHAALGRAVWAAYG
ncbi:MAG TPA: hypothetical protein VFT63_01025 [bacterium]|nr:hypothetical protein [bacterium]